jgi:hypothetical protein
LPSSEWVFPSASALISAPIDSELSGKVIVERNQTASSYEFQKGFPTPQPSEFAEAGWLLGAVFA